MALQYNCFSKKNLNTYNILFIYNTIIKEKMRLNYCKKKSNKPQFMYNN